VPRQGSQTKGFRKSVHKSINKAIMNDSQLKKSQISKKELLYALHDKESPNYARVERLRIFFSKNQQVMDSGK